MASVLVPGTAAPGFKLRVTPDQYLSLGDLVGKPVILAFYPADWSPVCGDQMALYNQVLPEFRRHGAELIGISVDGAWCHEAFSKTDICTSRCSRILSRKGMSPNDMALIGSTRGCANGRCL